MKMLGRERKELVNSIVQSYPVLNDLERVISYELNEQLDEIAGGDTNKEIIFNLIKWTESTGKLRELLEALFEDRPDNLGLHKISEKLLEKYFKEDYNLHQKSSERISIENSFHLSTIPDHPDFHGRSQEIKEIKKNIHDSRVTVIWGEPGIGKTYLSAQVAQQLSGDYIICWLEKDELTLSELLLEINEFLKAHHEQGFETTYSLDKDAGVAIPVKKKIRTLIEVIKANKAGKILFFIENLHSTNYQSLKDFIEQFRIRGGDNRLVLVDRFPDNSLGTKFVSKIEQFEVSAFQTEDACSYINRLSQISKIKCSQEDILRVCKKTEKHPLAIDLVMACFRSTKGAVSIESILNEIVDYDQRAGAELRQNFFSDIASYLDDDEQEALRCLSVLRTSVKQSVQINFEIQPSIWNSLLQHNLLKFEGRNNFRLHSLINAFWYETLPQDKKNYWHKKAANYYFSVGEEEWKESKKLEKELYLESFFHWQKIKKISKDTSFKKEATVESIKVLNKLSACIYRKERLPSERLSSITEWLFEIDERLLQDMPWLLLEKGRKLEKNGMSEKAELIFEQACEIFTRLNQEDKQLGTSITWYYIGKMRFLMRQYESALDALERAFVIAQERKDRLMQSRTLVKISSCYLELDQIQDSEKSAEIAEKIVRQSKDVLGLALILYCQGKIKRHQSNFSQAEKLFQESAQLFEELRDFYRQSKSLVRLGICQYHQTKYKDAERNYQHAIQLKETIEDWHGIARDRDYLADIYRSNNQYDKASETYLESLHIKEGNTEINRDEYGVIKTYNNLARLELIKRDFDKCFEWLNQSEETIKQHSKYFSGLDGSRLMILGDLQVLKGEYELALKSYEDAKQRFSPPHLTVPYSYNRILLNLGRTYLTLGEIEPANEYILKSYDFFESHSMSYYQSLSLIYLSRVKALGMSVEEARSFNQQARDLAQKIKSKSLLSFHFRNKALIELLIYLTKLKGTKSNYLHKKKEEQSFLEEINLYYDQSIDYYDQSIERIDDKKNISDRFKLKYQRYLCHFIINFFERNPISHDDAYGILKSEKIPRKIVNTELSKIAKLVENLNKFPKCLAEIIAEVSLNIISPLAIRFGFNNYKEQIENNCFAFLHPQKYKEITNWLERKYPKREELIQDLIDELELELDNINIIGEIEIQQRVKSVYSIYKKQQSRNVSLDKILDFIGIRLITETKENCYKVLTIVQELGVYFGGEGILQESLRDYIKNPKKSTGYQSIHINIVYGHKENQIIEFQIRTLGMHLAAEYGIDVLGLKNISHSYYKDSSRYSSPSSRKNYRLKKKTKITIAVKCPLDFVPELGELITKSKLELLELEDIDKTADGKILIEINLVLIAEKGNDFDVQNAQSELLNHLSKTSSYVNGDLKFATTDDSKEDIKRGRVGLSLEEKSLLIIELQKLAIHDETKQYIYTVTPKGDIVKLLKGASCIDFAYAIHGEVGDQCVRAKVNNQIVKLNTSLENGDRVEIFTQENSRPSINWLHDHDVVTHKAIYRIKRWAKKLEREKNITDGREILQRELEKERLGKYFDSHIMLQVVNESNYHNKDSLLASIGHGETSAVSVTNRLKEILKLNKHVSYKQNSSQIIEKKQSSSKIDFSSELPIKGVEGILYRLAHCCNPILNQPIIGIVTTNVSRGISIHTQECLNWRSTPPERRIKVGWNLQPSQNYRISIRIKMSNKLGVLEQVSSQARKSNINILKATVDCYSNGIAILDFCLDINSAQQFESFCNRVKNIKEYISIQHLQS